MTDRPLVLITGASGNIGRSIAAALARQYRVVGLDVRKGDVDFPVIEVDLTDQESVRRALADIRQEHGEHIASVVHLAAYFDFTGEDKPQYRAVNVEGSRNLVEALRDHKVEQFLYSGTMLVHEAGEPGEKIDETQPIKPGWAYPRSKAEAEQAISDVRGDMSVVYLHLAGLYDERTLVPTFAHQIARIYERDFQSHLYSGDTDAGQAMVHREDMIDAFVRAIDRRAEFTGETVILVGEPETLGYADLQDRLGCLIHGEDEWETIRVPAAIAGAGAWAQDKAEPLVPDAIDGGERPFIQPFMTRMASDHYEIDIGRARTLLGWEPRHRVSEKLPEIVKTLKDDPAGWYKANKVPPPAFVEEAVAVGENPESLRAAHERDYRAAHTQTRWAHFINIALGCWILTQPVIVQVTEPLLFWSEIALGAALILFSTLALSWRMGWARWAAAGVAAGIMAVPFLFWTTNPAAFLSDTLVGAFAFGLAVGTRPDPGPSVVASMTGPEVPPGWSYNPSTWTQRVPIIFLALVGLLVSRYLTAYQLGQIDGVWDPFFPGLPDDPSKNGTEAVITSSVSEAFPIPDAALGGYTYALEIVTGLIGSQARWRTMPWLVFLFGLMIAPLGVVSIFFIIIQPIVIGTWATLTLIAAAAMLIQIPYSLDELLATLQFVRRRAKLGRPWLRVFLFGDTDEGQKDERADEFDRGPAIVLRDMWAGGVNLPWNLALAGALALILPFSRLTFGAEGMMADADHLLGLLAITVISLAAAEVARALRFLLVPLGLAIAASPLMLGGTTIHCIANAAIGVALVGLSFRRGAIRERYGSWDRRIV
ncbi:MAG: NAD-dependent epimerase/dehydratase family protein [Alphaproteobacteria bacterium]|nr:NAD-dependent epimerase/dehydratase family protein [Alphaproteobacteria bacterium]MBU0794830.1 NAD-dependent epimerase/dehydratase family protein [Alphaproteobacteria bacterium]MBU0876215.1 NAD-dependent epimerase/dehydratase family protein [Alphaproteobacteria bacterium]MBU1768736.1 NAD-dependent epimerase/dehydratase family protein [Alphaproteobacteria bacterium]